MKAFQIGDKARIIDAPERGEHLINKIVTICPIGGFGYEEDDVCAQLEDGGMLMFLKEHQLMKV